MVYCIRFEKGNDTFDYCDNFVHNPRGLQEGRFVTEPNNNITQPLVSVQNDDIDLTVNASYLSLLVDKTFKR